MLWIADFYNWNRIKVRYCDGSSFTGDVEAVNPVSFTIFKGISISTCQENITF
jgi:hypothetical protein